MTWFIGLFASIVNIQQNARKMLNNNCWEYYVICAKVNKMCVYFSS